MNTVCNIDKSDRMNRAVIGLIIVIAALFGMGKVFFIVVGSILFIEGVIGWCAIVYFASWLRSKK